MRGWEVSRRWYGVSTSKSQQRMRQLHTKRRGRTGVQEELPAHEPRSGYHKRVCYRLLGLKDQTRRGTCLSQDGGRRVPRTPLEIQWGSHGGRGEVYTVYGSGEYVAISVLLFLCEDLDTPSPATCSTSDGRKATVHTPSACRSPVRDVTITFALVPIFCAHGAAQATPPLGKC